VGAIGGSATPISGRQVCAVAGTLDRDNLRQPWSTCNLGRGQKVPAARRPALLLYRMPYGIVCWSSFSQLWSIIDLSINQLRVYGTSQQPQQPLLVAAECSARRAGAN
jgi:hypothetical protein